LFVITAASEADSLKKQYTKILDAYGCLGILKLSKGLHLFIVFVCQAKTATWATIDKSIIAHFIREKNIMSISGNDDVALFLVTITSYASIGKLGSSEIFRITGVACTSMHAFNADEDKVTEIKKLLSSGMFYFSWSSLGAKFELSLSAQNCTHTANSDSRFFW
jgi:hypothetical protein